VRRPAPRVTFYLRLLAGAAGFAAAVVAGAALFVARRDRTRVPRDVARLIGRLVCPAARLRVRVRGGKHLVAGGPCVYVANHQSYLDYAILGTIYPERTVVLGRADLARIPLVGWLFRATGNLLVERGDVTSRRVALESLADAVRAGRSVWVFPEGTRNGEPGTLLPFHRGAFHVAARLDVPVVPIVVEPLRPLTDLRARRLTPRTVEVRVLRPVRPRGRGPGALADDVRARMSEALASAGTGAGARRVG
jgi:1-acyl-sn-glycerol-3-phosphate acyltransferase